jgi:hypothetical protein
MEVRAEWENQILLHENGKVYHDKGYDGDPKHDHGRFQFASCLTPMNKPQESANHQPSPNRTPERLASISGYPSSSAR